MQDTQVVSLAPVLVVCAGAAIIVALSLVVRFARWVRK